VLTGCFALAISFKPHSCRAQYEEAFQFDYPQRYRVIDSIGNTLFFYSDSNTALASYNQLRQQARRHEDKKALLLADKLEFFYRFTPGKLNGTAKQAALLAQRILASPENKKIPAVLASIHYGLGIYYFDHQKDYIRAFEHFLRSYNIFNGLGIGEFPDKGFYLFDYAMRLYRFEDYESAIRYASDADKYPYRNMKDIMFNQNLLGMCFLRTNKFHSARSYFRRTHRYAMTLTKELDQRWEGWQGISLGNIGNCWHAAQQYDSAKYYLNQGLKLTQRNGIWDNASGFATRLADLHLKAERYDLAAHYLHEAEQATQLGGSDQNQFEMHQAFASYFRATGNVTAALQHLDSVDVWREKIRVHRDANSRKIAEFRIAAENLKNELNLREADLRTQRTMRNSLLGLLFLGMLLALSVIKYRQEKARRREDLLIQEKAIADLALSNARAELSRFADDIHQKNQLIETMEKIRPTLTELNEEKIQALEKMRQSVILTEQSWEVFRENFETAYPGFIAQLKQNHPVCTAAEYRLMMLDKLNLSNKEMASMLGISPETIRSTRSRLRKKLAPEGAGSAD